jgi:DNA-binding SARP family transcriptional activator/DNA-binding GntR family transcriptional regulator
MEFRLLGPLEATDGRDAIPLGPRKQRAVLARLLLDVNRTVSVGTLVDDLWGEAVPGSAAKMVQIHVSQLRKVLPEGILRTQSPGYLLAVEPETLDVTRFTRLRGAGRQALADGDAAAARERLGEALAVWRGPALAEFDEPFAVVERAHLEELRLACLEDRIAADVALGRHADLVGELEALSGRHPLREALHRHLMLALYRVQRQAEALAAYDRFRRRLQEELGIEPSPALRELQFRILNQDPELEPAAAAPAPRRDERRAEPFVGRDGELARLDEALTAAEGGRGGAVLISGPAGIGKTRLAGAFAERAQERGATVLTGRCMDLVGAGVPYLPFVEALRPIHGSPAVAELGPRLRELPRLLPEFPGAPEGDAGVSRLRLFEEARAVLARLAAEAPVVLVLEDLHWADESTLDLVAFLAHGATAERLLLVATQRSETPHPALTNVRWAAPMALEPLAREDLEQLLEATAARPLSRVLTAAIVIRSQGNPFFAKELLAAAQEGRRELPPALRDAVLADIARLSPDARAAVEVVAAASRDVPYRLLAAVAGPAEPELAAALREAVDHGVLVADQAAGAFRFRHALFAEAVYATLLPGELERVHARLARALTAEPGLAASRSAAAEAAHHWAAAGRHSDALAASLQAAREAEAVSGLTEALWHVERVLDLWDRVPAAEQPADVALPTIIAWAAELAGVSAQRAGDVDARLLLGALRPGETVTEAAVARRLGVSRAHAGRALAALERDGLVERADGAGFRPARLGMTEARRLYPAAVVLESIAVRRSAPFDAEALAALRAANDRLRAAREDPPAAVAADDEFHRLLTARCRSEHLVAALAPIKRALLRYEGVYMRDPERIERSAEQHDAIVAALGRGDLAEAAQRVRENLARGLPELSEVLEG